VVLKRRMASPKKRRVKMMLDFIYAIFLWIVFATGDRVDN